MRVLITNNALDVRAGSELYVRDIALALLRRGFDPVAYSSKLGRVADELRQATVPVIDDLAQLAISPDVIHAQHHLDAMTAMLRFPNTPAVYFCHGWMPWEEMAPRFPTIRGYVAVDDLCRERLQCVHGIAPEQIRTIRNFVDLTRFPLRSELPIAPRRALVFSNNAREDGYLGAVRKACAARGIEVDAIGISVCRSEAQPERLIKDYDLVFAKARCALEALASGAAVIACDAAGVGGMVGPHNYDELRRLNFGIRCLRNPITVETVSRELDLYQPQQARAVSLRVRAEASLEVAIDQIMEAYQEAISAHSAAAPIRAEHSLESTSNYLRQISDFAKGRHLAEEQRIQLAAEASSLRQQCQRLQLCNEALQRQLDDAAAALNHQQELVAAMEAASALRTAELSAAEHSLALRNGELAVAEQALALRNSELESIHRSRLWWLGTRVYRIKHAVWNGPLVSLKRYGDENDAFEEFK